MAYHQEERPALGNYKDCINQKYRDKTFFSIVKKDYQNSYLDITNF